MNLLQQIIEETTNDKTSISSTLRKCRVLAARLRHTPLTSWVDSELNGYGDGKDGLPNYRVVTVIAKGHFRGPFGAEIRNQPLPASVLDKQLQDWATTAYLTKPIASYEQLVSQHKGKAEPGGTFRTDWPADLVMLHQRDFFEGYALVAAWQQIPASTIYALLDTVRNRILSFALEIEATAPNAGEPSPVGEQIPTDKLTQTFNTFILGGSNLVSAGNVGGSHSAILAVSAGDLSSLKRALQAIGVDESDLDDLRKF